MVKDHQSLDWKLTVMPPNTLGHGCVYAPDMRVHTGANCVQKRIQSNSVKGQAAWTLQAPGGLATVSAPGHDQITPPQGCHSHTAPLGSHSLESPMSLAWCPLGSSDHLVVGNEEVDAMLFNCCCRQTSSFAPKNWLLKSQGQTQGQPSSHRPCRSPDTEAHPVFLPASPTSPSFIPSDHYCSSTPQSFTSEFYRGVCLSFPDTSPSFHDSTLQATTRLSHKAWLLSPLTAS